LILLLVAIGMLNVCLGFGLAMYYGYGPPGINGIFQALGPMPAEMPTTWPIASSELATPSDPPASPAEMETAPHDSPEPVVVAPDAAPHAMTDQPLAEEGVLSEVRDMAAAAETALASGEPQARA